MRSNILKSAKTVLLAGITALLLTLPAFVKTTIPSKPYLYVKDEADVLSADEEDDLNRILSQYDKETGNQIAVLLVETTGNDSIERYSYQVATKWGIGQADKDNGILITIATDDHKDRIEVGKGLEECVTDARSGHILRSDEVKTAFRNGKWYDGTKSIITQVQNCIQTDGKEIDQAMKKEKEAVIDQLAVAFSVVSISCWISMIVASYLVFGLIGLAAAILIGIFAPFPATCVFCLISIVTFAMTLVSSISTGSFGGGSSSGDWSSGGGGWSSGGSSFGGGSFGGGGASGSW